MAVIGVELEHACLRRVEELGGCTSWDWGRSWAVSLVPGLLLVLGGSTALQRTADQREEEQILKIPLIPKKESKSFIKTLL